MNADWDRYLDQVEVSIREVEHAIAEHQTPVWSAPDAPDGAPPDATLARRDGLLVRMMVAAHTVEQLRDGVRADIEALPAPRPRAAVAYAGTIGTTFDYSG